MTNLLKWIYTLGVQHERRRVKLLIEKHRNNKPELHYFQNDKDEYNRRLDFWHAVEDELSKLTENTIIRETQWTSKLEEEDL